MVIGLFDLIISSRFICAEARNRLSFLLRLHSVPLYIHTKCCLFIPLLMDLWWCPPLRIVNSTSMTMGVGIFLQESVFSSFGSGPRSKISGSRNSSIFNFLRKLYCFPSWLYHFMCPPMSTSLLGLVFSCFFDSGHPTKCKPLFHCGAHVHSPDDEGRCPSFHVFDCHLHISFGEIC